MLSTVSCFRLIKSPCLRLQLAEKDMIHLLLLTVLKYYKPELGIIAILNSNEFPSSLDGSALIHIN